MLKLLVLLVLLAVAAEAASNNEDQLYFGGGAAAAGSLVKRDLRRSLVETEFGSVSSIDVNDGHRKPYHIQFITLEPNSLFLPVLLHADMVFYVHTGSGRLSWADEDEDDIKRVEIKRGDLFRLNPGSVFFVQSALQTERQKLRIYAIFATNTEDDLYDPSVGAYSSIRDLIRGFDPKVLRSAFKVSEEVIQAIINGTDQSLIVHAVPTKQENFWDLESRFLRAFLVGKDGIVFNSHKKKTKTYNIFDEDPDFENCNGWSLTVNKKNSKLLKGSNIGLFMVNLTTGSMMGPHWNPMATEIAIVLEGQGMVRVVCSSTAAKKSECKNMRFRVREGDVFAVPRFHPMAQMSFNNNSLVFMGFSTNSRRNHPQFLAGKNSVLQALDKQVLAATFNITKTTVDQLLAAQADSLIIDCTSCAEEEERAMLEEIQKEREEEEAKKREEEEARKREEEEAAARKREEEEAARKREEEAARKREEEEAARKRKEEEARQREEEVARRREEEEAARKREEEEEARQQEEEQAARQREEEQAARQRQEEAARKREEEAAGQQEEEQAARQREQEQAARQREEEEAARKREEEEARQREEEGGQGQGEEGKRQEEERERERRQQEEWERREQEAQREQEEARRQQEERHARRAQRAEQGGGGGSMDAGEGRRYLKVVNV